MQCKNCGEYLQPGSTFCTKCGYRIDEYPDDTDGYYQEQKRNPSNTYMYVILAVVLALVLATAYLIFIRDGSSKPEPEPTATASLEATATPTVTPAPTATATPTPTTTASAPVPSVDVESEVIRIREAYNAIESEYENGSMVEVNNNGAQKYVGSNGKMKVIAPSGDNNIPYEQYYYYIDNELIFAYFDASDSYRLYFSDNKLIRLRYCKDADDYENAVNHDLENSSEYAYWERAALDAAARYC